MRTKRKTSHHRKPSGPFSLRCLRCHKTLMRLATRWACGYAEALHAAALGGSHVMRYVRTRS